MNPETEYFWTVASESELNDILEGRESGNSFKWKPPVSPRLTDTSTGIVWKRRASEGQVLPLGLVVRHDDLRRLCGRFAQLRSDLSPLTAWCHLFSPNEFEALDSLDRKPSYGRCEASWTGLIVAEAQLLSSLPVAELRISACLATQSFAIARATASWAHVSPNAAIEKFDAANKLIRRNISDRTDFLSGRLRAALFPIWNSLAALSGTGMTYTAPELEPITASSQRRSLTLGTIVFQFQTKPSTSANPLMGISTRGPGTRKSRAADS